MIHELKCWVEFFEQTWQGKKSFELRKNDRDYHASDTVILHEWNKTQEEYTGRKLEGTITYLIEGFGLMDEYCVFQLGNIRRRTPEFEPVDTGHYDAALETKEKHFQKRWDEE